MALHERLCAEGGALEGGGGFLLHIVCKALSRASATLGLWSSVRCVHIEQLAGAMSNAVYRITRKASLSDREPESLILRLYGTHSLGLNRESLGDVEAILGEAGLGPRVYARFPEGSLVEYVDGEAISSGTTCDPSWMGPALAKLSHIHRMLPEIVARGIFPMRDLLWARLALWRGLALAFVGRVITSSGGDEGRPGGNGERRAALCTAILASGAFEDGLLSGLEEGSRASASPLVLGHCDLHCGNIIRWAAECGRGSDDGATIIDFEYAIPCARGFDLAVLFCEQCADYGAPSEASFDPSAYPKIEWQLQVAESYLCGNGGGEGVLSLLAEVEAHTDAAHLTAAFWALAKAGDGATSDDDLGYLSYAAVRLEQISVRLVR